MRGAGLSCRSAAALGMLAALAAIPLAACRPAEPDHARPRTVILISLDTLRKDAVGVYRGSAATGMSTPVLDAFARDAVAVDGARTPMPFTLPAHMSLLTSQPPRVHGVSHGDRRLSAELGTLPEWLREAGFETHGVAVNYWMKGGFGFERGFDSYELVEQGLVSSGRVNAALRRILDQARSSPGTEQSLFLFVQYFDAHSASTLVRQNALPYYSPPAYRNDLAALPEGQLCDATEGCASGFLLGADLAGRAVAPGTLAHVRALYDRSVSHLDAQLGEFFDDLKRRDLYDEALIVVTSDHGEEFREHGRFLHSQTYDETLAVPLLVKLPQRLAAGVAGTRAVGLAMLEDVAPTILDVLGLPLPDTAQGVSLLPLMLRGESVRELVVSQDKSRRSRHAIVADGYKLIFDFASGDMELYDLTSDPLETKDLARANPKRAAGLQRRLAGVVAQNTQLAERFRAAAPMALLSDEEQAALRAMGYIEEPVAR